MPDTPAPDTTVRTLRDANRRRRNLIVRIVLAVILVAIVAVGAYGWRFRGRMLASLPQLDGDAVVTGLSANVTIARDALGVPTISGQTRVDVARALGFLHGQERFFQMDLSRRHAAGELSELFGKKTLEADKASRIHGLREIARTVLAQLPDDQKALLAAYAEGVNAGLARLGEQPFEYLVIGEAPQPWKPEDSILAIHAMAIDLQHPDASYEHSLMLVRDYYDNRVLNFFAPQITTDDSALDGSTEPLPPIPGPYSINIPARVYEMPKNSSTAAVHIRDVEPAPRWLGEGSNNMALGGALTVSGAGMIENDMHLTLRVPNTWYRASISWTDAAGAHQVTGITIPGAPAIVAGSNGHIAWGFTNSFADTSDLIVLTPDIASNEFYNVPRDILAVGTRTETIQVRGEKTPVTYNVPTTIWGPVVGQTLKGQKIVLKWVFHDPAAANYDILGLETARDVQEAVAIAHHAGIPVQNMLVADTSGAIAWTLCGRIPKRVGYDGRLPSNWAFGDRSWAGFVPPEEIPTVINPDGARLSTANQRLFGGKFLEVIGDGGTRPGQRGARIQELLSRIEGKAVPADLLAVSLDEHAPYLARWHALLRQVLSTEVTGSDKSLARLRDAAGEVWNDAASRASIDSHTYPIVSKFREHVMARVLYPVFEPCIDEYPKFNYNRFHSEEPVWRLIQEKPKHLLSSVYGSWDDLLLAAARDVVRDLKQAGFSNPADAKWGAFNVARIRHPLSSALPGFLADTLDMPADQLAGDDDMPRVQHPSYGASDRFVVSPGHESEGIFQMPGSQSGHPFSPYYRAGHEAWVKGESTPFLPGPTQHTLVLKPR